MGIKENFAQALKELAVSGRDERADKKSAQVETLRKAVEDEGIIKPRGEMSDYATAFESEQTGFIPDENVPLAGEIGANAGDDDAGRYYQPNIPMTPYGASYSAYQNNINTEPETTYSQPQPQTINQTQATYGGAAGVNSTVRSQEPAQFSMPANNINAAQSASFSGQQTVSTARPAYNEEEITVISKNTVVDGNIRSFANMMIDGDIKGDIETTKNIDLNGKVIGNLICNNAEMHSSQIQGNIRLKGNVVMERDTLLIGDLVSTYAKINGKIKGNLDISGKAEFKSDSVIFGDISASTITVGDGAIIQGYVSTTFLSKEESINIFPEAINIGE